jgi:hypothetical protein
MGARRKPLPRLRAGEVAAKRRVRAIGSARCKALLRAGPITLTLGAARLDLSHFAGEV